jgi:hypothetical protein
MGNGAMFWDLSDLDGNGANMVGTPFTADNVKATPVGPGSGVGTCLTLSCAANDVCLAAYQQPDDVDTKVSIPIEPLKREILTDVVVPRSY